MFGGRLFLVGGFAALVVTGCLRTLTAEAKEQGGQVVTEPSARVVSGTDLRQGKTIEFSPANPGEDSAPLLLDSAGNLMREGDLVMELSLPHAAPIWIHSTKVFSAPERYPADAEDVARVHRFVLHFNRSGRQDRLREELVIESWFGSPLAVWENGASTSHTPGYSLSEANQSFMGVTFPLVRDARLGVRFTLKDGSQTARPVTTSSFESEEESLWFAPYWKIDPQSIKKAELFAVTQKTFRVDIPLPGSVTRPPLSGMLGESKIEILAIAHPHEVIGVDGEEIELSEEALKSKPQVYQSHGDVSAGYLHTALLVRADPMPPGGLTALQSADDHLSSEPEPSIPAGKNLAWVPFHYHSDGHSYAVRFFAYQKPKVVMTLDRNLNLISTEPGWSARRLSKKKDYMSLELVPPLGSEVFFARSRAYPKKDEDLGFASRMSSAPEDRRAIVRLSINGEGTTEYRVEAVAGPSLVIRDFWPSGFKLNKQD